MTEPVTAGGNSPNESGLAWLGRFRAERGRPLSVLHIGNIANNAYNNAKIQRLRGIDADVSCHDYYHVMGCPEWEDADFRGDFVDEFYPDWWNVDLGGYERPVWFAQGTMHTSLRYLDALRLGDHERVSRLSHKLARERWLRCRSTGVAKVARALVGTAATPLRASIAWLLVPARILGRRSVATMHALRAAARGESLRTIIMIFLPVRLVPRAWRSVLAAEADELPARFRAEFPERVDPLTPSDYYELRFQIPFWKPLLQHYDVIQAYATDGAIPLLARTSAWAAYEHGTLREIPFETSPRGRLCALTYHEAPAVFITNSDVLPSAERLGLERVVYLPHAVDTDRLFAFADAHAEHRHPDQLTIYAPTRQDWVDRDASWTKGNDILLRGAASIAANVDFRLVLAEWGRDLDATRILLSELGLADRVEWVPPLRKRELWARYLASHVVVDQFVLPAIGGVAFEAMALGRRVVTAIDAEQTERFFGRTPPVLAARTPDEVAAALEKVIADPADDSGLGAAARAWVAEFHSSDRIVDLQAQAYRRLLEGASAPSPFHA